MMCNIMTGSGFTDLGVMGTFSMAWLGLAILFFIIAFARKWIGEGMGMQFNFITGAGLGIFTYIIIVTISCSYKFALVGGLIGAVIGGIFLGSIIGDSDE